MNLLHAILLGIVEGITEFLPVSSTGHLNIVEKLLGYQIDSPGMTAFTAVIQVGAIIAAIVFFWKDIVAIVVAWCRGIVHADKRDDPNYRMGWAVILGSIPVAVVGLAFKNAIETTARSLWVIVGALLVWSIVMAIADRRDHGERTMVDVTWKDGLIIGLFQALAPVFPGISRSGATISAGLFRGMDRVSATKLSFFLGIPALVAAGGMEAISQAGAISAQVGWLPTAVATVVSLVVAYVSIAWLLRFVSKNSFTGFIVYRIILAAVIIVLIMMGVVAA
ncbi:undecaprenyl-diphosphate phosphatase [Propionibacterium freudenreichii]|uniref:undecaprenyl-diphosphate phosphatase n=1 Tax=Propionibacterium freudenreichii TaxID=1744 RepID=UPI0005433633|nr:undecaprenyl-diphosphate phosphatase [Propionibacterium freudenreichii]CEG93955.1 Undecaprenyl-diphosphatase (Undecaprenyl pyrophosphate phosphatase) (Bacitracin resistance protein) [Propionibacterium freudenreichii]